MCAHLAYVCCWERGDGGGGPLGPAMFKYQFRAMVDNALERKAGVTFECVIGRQSERESRWHIVQVITDMLWVR